LSSINRSIVVINKNTYAGDKQMIISNLDEMKEHLAVIKSQASSWLSSSDGSYEACLHDNGYYALYNNIKIIEELEQIEDSMSELKGKRTILIDKLYGEG
jgi:hypothetical protein